MMSRLALARRGVVRHERLARAGAIRPATIPGVRGAEARVGTGPTLACRRVICREHLARARTTSRATIRWAGRAEAVVRTSGPALARRGVVRRECLAGAGAVVAATLRRVGFAEAGVVARLAVPRAVVVRHERRADTRRLDLLPLGRRRLRRARRYRVAKLLRSARRLGLATRCILLSLDSRGGHGLLLQSVDANILKKRSRRVSHRIGGRSRLCLRRRLKS